MHSDRTRRRGSAAPTLAVARDTPPALRRLVSGARYRIADDAGLLLVNDDGADIEIAQAAWRILEQTGGVLDRTDIAKRHGLTRQRTFALTKNKGFPDPVGVVGGRPVWIALHVDHYRASSRTGRPRIHPEHD